MESEIKSFYATHHDRIFDKRFNSGFPVRRRTHRSIYDSVLRHIQPGTRVLDAGCGEGVLSILMTRQEARVTGVDYSAPNIQAAMSRASEAGLERDAIDFRVADVENLPFEEGSFDCVVSNHVLEHLPDFERGLREIHRVTRDRAIIAVPTCLSPCSWALLGGDVYWKLTKRSLLGVPLGLSRVFWALLSGREGVNEGYAGNRNNVHFFRFPWVVKRWLLEVGFEILHHEAQAVCLPYVPWDLRLPRSGLISRNLGLGTLFVVRRATRKDENRHRLGHLPS